jgi:putative heme uptake system protein
VTGRRLLAWDAPNIDMVIAQILGSKPTSEQRPDFEALARWFVAGGGPDVQNEAAVFANVPEFQPSGLLGWLTWLSSKGYRIFARPKAGDSDIDEDVLAYLQTQVAAGDVAEIVVASHDARAFLRPLEELADQGVKVRVIAFAELAGGLGLSDRIEFIDLEDIPGLFRASLPRLRLATLPEEGGWFEPRGRLGE